MIKIVFGQNVKELGNIHGFAMDILYSIVTIVNGNQKHSKILYGD